LLVSKQPFDTNERININYKSLLPMNTFFKTIINFFKSKFKFGAKKLVKLPNYEEDYEAWLGI
jgi:hypothetical protein